VHACDSRFDSDRAMWNQREASLLDEKRQSQEELDGCTAQLQSHLEHQNEVARLQQQMKEMETKFEAGLLIAVVELFVESIL
jgi:hypothetical protein